MERGLDASPPSHRASPSQQIGQRVDQQVDQLGRESDYDDDTSEHESAFSLQNTSRFYFVVRTITCIAVMITKAMTLPLVDSANLYYLQAFIGLIGHRCSFCLSHRFLKIIVLGLSLRRNPMINSFMAVQVSSYSSLIAMGFRWFCKYFSFSISLCCA